MLADGSQSPVELVEVVLPGGDDDVLGCVDVQLASPGALGRRDAPEPVRFSRCDARCESERQPALTQSAVACEQCDPTPQQPAAYKPVDVRRTGIYEACDLQGLCGPESYVQVEKRLCDRPRVGLLLPEIGDDPDGLVQWVGVRGSGRLDGVDARARQAFMSSGVSLNHLAASASWSVASKGSSTLSSSRVMAVPFVSSSSWLT